MAITPTEGPTMSPELNRIREVYDRRIAPIAGIINVDAPEEGEATERVTKEVIVYTDETTTLGEVFRTAQALEKAGFEARVKFTRLDGGDEFRSSNPVWGITIGVRSAA